VIGAIILAHLVGDYVLQTHWMATEKVNRWWPAIAHGVTYTLPFLLITTSPLALLVIGGTHVVIDRYRLAKYLVWAKNQLAPKSHRPRHVGATGATEDSPAWLAVWLMIIADNTAHLVINVAAVNWL
jgi:hypothetical protein